MRKYGGVKLGAERFQCYIEAMNSAIDSDPQNTVSNTHQTIIHQDTRKSTNPMFQSRYKPAGTGSNMQPTQPAQPTQPPQHTQPTQAKQRYQDFTNGSTPRQVAPAQPQHFNYGSQYPPRGAFHGRPNAGWRGSRFLGTRLTRQPIRGAHYPSTQTQPRYDELKQQGELIPTSQNPQFNFANPWNTIASKIDADGEQEILD